MIGTLSAIKAAQARLSGPTLPAMPNSTTAGQYAEATASTSSPQPWGSLGGITFSRLSGPYEFNDKQGVDFAEHALAFGKPRLQAVGMKLEEITLRIRLAHTISQANPDTDLNALLEAMRGAQPQALVIGQANNGIYAGQFVISDIEHDRIEQWPNGAIKIAEASVKLREWVEPPALTTSKRKNPTAVRHTGKKTSPRTQTDLVVKQETRGASSTTMPIPHPELG